MNMRSDNKGFSLVEVIIAVTIIAVLTGTVGYGLSFVSGRPAEECARKTVSILQHARTITMGKYKVVLSIENHDGQISIIQSTYKTQSDYDSATPDITASVVSSKAVKFEYSDDGTNYQELTDGSSLQIEFSRSTGALKSKDAEDVPDESKTYWKYFRISKAHTVKNISILPLTGRTEVCD